MRYLATVLFLVTALRGQQPAPVQFRSGTDTVALDVIVLGRNRQPVRGLTAADFTVLDDGVPQPITAFLPVEAAEPDAAAPKWASRAVLDVQSNNLPDGRLVLLYMDERIRTGDPFVVGTAKKIAHNAIDQLAPNDVAAVAFVVDHRVTQEFTTDRGRLHAAVDNYRSSPPIQISVVGTMRDLAEHLGAIPDRRKVVLYIGSGEPFDQRVLSTMQLVTIKGMSVGAAATADENIPFTFGSHQQRDLFNGLLDLFRTAQRANVTIYALDPAGLSPQPIDRTGAPAGCQVWYDNNPMSCEILTDFLRMVADATGGRAVVKNNAPATEVPAILRENAVYYLIGFTPAKLPATGRFHRIDVRVNRPGVEVRARRGYVEPVLASSTAGTVPPPTPARPLVPASDVRVTLAAIPVGPAPPSLANVALVINATAANIDQPNPVHVEISYVIATMDTREVASGRREFTAVPDHGVVTVDLLALERLSPGKYDIRLSARLREGDRQGGLFGDVTVPDFRKDALSASGIVVVPTPPAHGLPADALLSVLKDVPTANREFGTHSSAAALLRIYQGSRVAPEAVTLRTTIIDARDRPVLQDTRLLAAAEFVAGMAEHRLQLSLSRLQPGSYLLRFEASRAGAQAVRRETRFEVK